MRVCGCARTCVHVYVRRLRRGWSRVATGVVYNSLPMASTMPN